jgi:hypothetical protein
MHTLINLRLFNYENMSIDLRIALYNLVGVTVGELSRFINERTIIIMF